VSQATLLVELLTEELPPKSLKELAGVFAWNLYAELKKDRLLGEGSEARIFATPRRLAVAVTQVLERSAQVTREVQGPPVSAAAQAVAGFAKKNGIAVEALTKQQGPKGEVYVAQVTVAGQALEATLAAKVEAALKSLPIPKVMRWGAGEAQFVRPAHGLVMMHGARTVAGKVLDIESGKRTRGHRFMGKGELTLANADAYEKTLGDEGMVVADYDKRKAQIAVQLESHALKLQANLGEYRPLLDEVTALVEHPTVYVGAFDKAFLAVPQECLILTMRQHQRYFTLFDAAGKLLPHFLIVSNMKVADPRHIVGGNQRVVRPRLEDARFFYDQDRKVRLADRVSQLGKVVYHNKLGSQLDRVKRIVQLSGKIAAVLKADASQAAKAAELCKADLLSGMVGEFPELQGIMGRYYALHDGEAREVADAIEAHYRPRFAGDKLPEGPVACAVALADKLDAIAGLFSIGQQPTGDKDPFGLRRAALGIVRILVENKLYLSLHELIKASFEPFKTQHVVEMQTFIYERFASYLKDLGYSTLQIESVLSKNPVNLSVVIQQLEAVKAFQLLPEAESLAAANKRVANILKQAEAKGETPEAADLREPAERALLEAIQKASEKAKALYEKGDYTGYLVSFSVLKAPVDTFFDKVKVMDDDPRLRRGRLALLRDLRESMNRVADISKLAT
jgi:glycyl-tRNA synthetase beta chain